MLTGGVDLKEHLVDETNVTLTGVIDDKFTKNGQNTLYISSGKRRFAVILASDNKYIEYYKIGQKIVVNGQYTNFKIAENDGQFNSRKYYRIRGFEAQIKKAHIIASSEEYNKYKESLHNIRTGVEKVYLTHLERREATTLCALCLGDKTTLDEDVKEAYQNAGISHVLSLSGLHIATLGLMLFSALQRGGISIKLSAIIAGIIMLSYSIMTGMSTSTKRALIMYIVAVIARCINRTYDLLSALTLSAILIICDNPYYMFDSGFLLSFMAVLSIAFINPVINAIFRDFTELIEALLKVEILYSDNKAVNGFLKVVSGVEISLSVLVMTLPVIMNYFYKTSRYGIVLNIIVVPLMTVILICGIAGGLSGVLKIPFISGLLTKIFLKVCEIILILYYKLADYFQSFKSNIWVLGRAEKIRIFIYITLIMLTILLNRYLRRYSTLTNDKQRRRIRFISDFVSISAIALSVYIISANAAPDLKIITMSVGQGSCNIIYGKNVSAVIYDGGSSDIKNVGKYRIIPCLLANGISEIEYVIISHNDADHVNGIKELLEAENTGIEIKNVIMSYIDEEVVKLCENRKTKVYIMSQKDEIKGEDFLIKCISPDRKTLRETLENNVNDASLVVMYTHRTSGFKILLTGDITSETENKIIPMLEKCNYATICHHGSRYSNCEEFLKKTNADIYTISAGYNNSYGHPHEETLKRLNDLKLNYLRTDKCGQITTTVNKGKITVEKYY